MPVEVTESLSLTTGWGNKPQTGSAQEALMGTEPQIWAQEARTDLHQQMVD